MKWRFCGVLILLFLSAWTTPGAATLALQDDGSLEPPAVEFNIVPQEISLHPGQGTVVAAVVENTGAVPIEDLHLTWLAELPLSVEVEQRNPTRLAPQDVISYSITVSLPPEGVDTATVNFRLDYTWNAGDAGDSARTGIRFAGLSVQRRLPRPVGEVAEIQLATGVETLFDRFTGDMHLQIENKSADPILVHPPSALAPLFLEISSDFESAQWVDGLGVLTIPVQVKAGDVIEPGSHLISFEVLVEQVQGGATTRYDLHASHILEVGVLGESQVLGVFASIPSFLVIPGVLFMISLQLGVAGRFAYEFRDPRFWYFAIPASLVILLVYFWIRGRNIAVNYGFLDIVWVWILSLVLGWLAVLLIRTGDWLVNRNQPRQTDTELSTLKKLGGRGGKLILEQVQVKTGDDESLPAFLLESRAADKQSYWVSPQIIVRLRTEIHEDLHEKLRDLLNDPQSEAKTLSAMLAEGMSHPRPAWTLAFSSRFISGVRRVPLAQIEDGVEAPLIALIDPD